MSNYYIFAHEILHSHLKHFLYWTTPIDLCIKKNRKIIEVQVLPINDDKNLEWIDNYDMNYGSYLTEHFKISIRNARNSLYLNKEPKSKFTSKINQLNFFDKATKFQHIGCIKLYSLYDYFYCYSDVLNEDKIFVYAANFIKAVEADIENPVKFLLKNKSSVRKSNSINDCLEEKGILSSDTPVFSLKEYCFIFVHKIDIDPSKITKYKKIKFVKTDKVTWIELDTLPDYKFPVIFTRRFTNEVIETILKLFDTTPVDIITLQNNYSNYFVFDIQENIKQLKSKIKALEENLLVCNNYLGENLNLIKVMKNSNEGFLVSTYTKFLSIKDIESVQIVNKGFIFTTKDIYINIENRHPSYCGVFEIHLLITDVKSLEYRNIASPNDSRHTPHGRCMGTFQKSLSSCLNNLDYYTLVLTLLKMLKTVNTNDSTAMRNYEKYFSEPNKPKVLYELEDFISCFYIKSSFKSSVDYAKANLTENLEEEDD